MLSIQDLSITYGKNSSPAVRNVALEIQRGEIVSIVGESGSGKTTVIRAVLGCLSGGGRVTGGDIQFEGTSLLKYSKEEWRKIRGTEISMIFQDSGAMINPIRRIGAQYIEYVRTHRKIPKKEAYEICAGMLKKMRLPEADHIMQSYPFQLSGGMRQRVGIAMAMTFQPRLLLADEPTSALDVTTQAQIVRQMMELRDKYHTSIVVVTHNLGVAAYMADKILVMRDGCVVEAGTREQILYHTENAYTRDLLDSVPTLGGERFV